MLPCEKLYHGKRWQAAVSCAVGKQLGTVLKPYDSGNFEAEVWN